MEVIGYLVIGLVAGWLAGVLFKGRSFGILGNLVVGIVGAILGGFVFELIGLQATSTLGRLVTATVGAVLLLALLQYLGGKGGRRRR